VQAGTMKTSKNRESIRDATAELQVKMIWSTWIPVFKIYQCYVPSINLLALLVHKKKIFKNIRKNQYSMIEVSVDSLCLELG
jgi:hypothetical protein